MSMTLEEAIEKVKILCAGADELSSEYEEQGSFIEAGMAVTFKNAFDTILSALRPVSREQVEKVWRGEWVGVPSMGVYDTVCSKCGYCPGIRFWSSDFCPHCGAPMTDEAVQMVMERLEELSNGKG